MHCTIRTANLDELRLAVEWAAQEGWNPGIHDVEPFYAADPHGYFVAIVDDEPVGSISAVAYGDSFGFVGFFIVKPEHRGQGIGMALWERGMAYLAGRNVGLDGVVDMVEKYEASGFRLAYNNARFEGRTRPGAPAIDVVPADRVPAKLLHDYDCRFFPAPRPEFLESWLQQPGGAALAALRSRDLRGYGVIRPCGVGFKVGPLFAEDAETAEQLLVALTATAPVGQPFFLDIPCVNDAAVALVQKHDMTDVFRTARMYTRGDPGLPVDQVFGVTTFELG